MRASTDEANFAEVYLETPFGIAHSVSGPDEAMRTPGCQLKTSELDAKGRWPKYFGTLSSYDKDKDQVVVISKPMMHGVDGKPTVWTGTIAEYLSMWRCD